MQTSLDPLVRECISVAEAFKALLDEESRILSENDLKKIAQMNGEKEELLKVFSDMKEQVRVQLKIPQKRFDQVDIDKHLSTLQLDLTELKPLIDKLWSLQQQCHNQFIINRNVISARMHFLNKTINDLMQSEPKEECAYTRSGRIEFNKPSIGKTTV